jgi:acyl-[acyl carrier protein]--UDP-N-acetylglucosamine O-acyltransferase
VAEVERQLGTVPEVRHIIDFVRASKRGIIR